MTEPVFPGDDIQFADTYINKLSGLIDNPPQQLTGINAGNAGPSTIFIKNITANFVNANGILAMGNSILEPDDDELIFRFSRPTFEGIEPVKGLDEYKFCVLHQGLDVNETGLATIFGRAIVLIDFIDPDHKYATLVDGESPDDATANLESSPSGPALIIWASNDESDGTGLAWGMIEFPAHEAPTLYKATADAESDGTILGRVVDSTGEDESTDPEFEFKAIV